MTIFQISSINMDELTDNGMITNMSYQYNSVTWGGGKMPGTIFSTWVEVRPVWTADLS